MSANIYRKQVALLIRALPSLHAEKSFALKGGTAINLFVRNMPRLSVDIDLTYLPLHDRPTSLAGISAALDRMSTGLSKLGLKVTATRRQGTKQSAKLVISSPDASIKIEPNEVLRGAVYPCITQPLCAHAVAEFEASVRVQTLSVADIFGGKLCAALDRQHPRDIFDVKLLLENEGFTPEIMNAFVVYLASHGRTMHELLRPTKKPLEVIFENEFSGMTTLAVTLAELERARDQMVTQLHQALTPSQRAFLISMKSAEPDFSVLGFTHLDRLPAIQWKLQNIRKLKTEEPKRHGSHLDALKKALGE